MPLEGDLRRQVFVASIVGSPTIRHSDLTARLGLQGNGLDPFYPLLPLPD